MIRHLILYGFTYAAAASIVPAFAEEGGCAAPSARAGLYLNDGSTASGGLPSYAKISVASPFRDLHLTYKMPPDELRAPAGIVAVKISQVPNPSDSPAMVRIRRDSYPYVCGTRDALDVINFYNWLQRVSPPVDQLIPVEDYIYYHKTTSDFRQVALYNFHVHYKNRAGSCVRTDDKSNGNREQFLYGERTLDNRLIAQHVSEGVGVAIASAAAGKLKGTPAEEYSEAQADKIKKAIKNNAEISTLSGRYMKLGKLETQIHSYSDNHGCIPIEISEAQSGQEVTISINDLERRDWHGKRVEEVWKLKIQ